MKPMILILLCASPALAETVLPTRVIRAREIIRAGDVALDPVSTPGALTSVGAAIGREARVALYPGRPVRPGDVGPPAVVERNDMVTLVYSVGKLRISTEGRVLGRGAAGETVRVMNLSSRQSVMGRIREDGAVEVE